MFRSHPGRCVRLTSMAIVAASLIVLPAMAQDAAQEVHVIEWRSSLVRILDAEGRMIDKVAADTLPAVPVPVLEVNERGMARIATDRGEVWLAPTSISLDHTAGILSDCERLQRVRTASGDRQKSSTQGYVSRGLSGCK